MKTTKIFTTLILAVVFLSSCSKDGNQREDDVNLIKAYIEDNGLVAESTLNDLYYVIDEPGNDEHPGPSANITIKYTGWFLDGTEFDSSDGKAVTFQLGNLIRGWKLGIPIFGKGGKGMLLIPSYLAYGTTGSQSGTIPPNSVVIFEIELITFN